MTKFHGRQVGVVGRACLFEKTGHDRLPGEQGGDRREGLGGNQGGTGKATINESSAVVFAFSIRFLFTRVEAVGRPAQPGKSAAVLLGDSPFAGPVVAKTWRFASSEQVVDNAAVNVGQPKIATVVPVGELLVVEAQQMQDRGMQIVMGNGVFDGVHA